MDTSSELEPESNAIAYFEPWKKSVEEWADILDNGVGGFEGDNQRAARIIAEMARGIKIVADEFEARGLEYVPPRIAILFGTGSEATSVIHDQENDAVIVGKRFLQDLSQFDPSNMYAFRRDDGEVTFKGSVSALVRNYGVEEAHHSAFYQYKKKKIPYVDANSMSMSEYDSSDHEYRALIWQKRVAQEEGDPQITVEHLAKRVEVARRVRKMRMDMLMNKKPERE